jgi:DnaJ-class molecular chaperone
VRYMLLPLAIVAGCVATLPDDHTVTADLACETARLVVKVRQEVAPSPASDKCENCVDGFIGDGKIKITCPVCKGTGKK